MDIPKLLTVKEVANILNIKVNTVYKWVDERRLPYIDLGPGGIRRCIRISAKELKSFIEENTRV